VIGVVSSINHAALNEPAQGNVYLATGAMKSAVFLVARTRETSEAAHRDLEKEIRRAIAAIDPSQLVFLSASMRALVADSVADRKFIMTLLGITGWLALLMAAAGVYGVISYTTSRRTQEIGIRVALGATPQNVHLLIFRQGFAAVAVGLIIGFCGVLPLMHALQGFLTGLDSQNAAYFWIATAFVTLAAGAACWIPARRAAQVDPLQTLRQE
jgi:ABC-type antimicrobial peptide transport system permease subunit